MAFRLLGRLATVAGAAVLLGLAVAWIVVGLVIADAYGEQKAIDFQRGGPVSAYDWDTLTGDPVVGSLFLRVFVATAAGLFLAFAAPLWTRSPPDGSGSFHPDQRRTQPERPAPPAAEVRPRPTLDVAVSEPAPTLTPAPPKPGAARAASRSKGGRKP